MRNKILYKWMVFCLSLLFTCDVLAELTSFQLSSPVFQDQGDIPVAYGRQEENMSPPLVWSGEPYGTQSFVLVVMDYDAKTKTSYCLYDCVYNKPNNPKCPVVHWLVYNVPKTQHQLDAGSKQFTQGMNTYHKKGYIGMNPPKGETHHYHFFLYALDKPIVHIPTSSNAHDVMYAVRHNILAKATLVGLYTQSNKQ